MCHHGVRSQHVALFLQGQGFDKLYNLKGGIAAWSREVDPKMPTY
jgi:rhodanese-related sulfurtransferase